MADETQILTGSMTELGIIIAAVAALGAAAQGLADVTKGWWIKREGCGFRFIKEALTPFDHALTKALGAKQSWSLTLWAHWLNGRNTSDQKAIAKSLIKLGLAPENAGGVAAALAIDSRMLEETVSAINAGANLTEEQVNLLGRMDATIDARLDAAYERADRRYRSVARNIAAALAVALALIAGSFLFADACAKAAAIVSECELGRTLIGDYLFSRHFALAFLVGLIAVPLAPVSKDLVSAIGAAARAVKAAKG